MDFDKLFKEWCETHNLNQVISFHEAFLLFDFVEFLKNRQAAQCVKPTGGTENDFPPYVIRDPGGKYPK